MESTIRRINHSDSVSELTLLIRRAYKALADIGFNYTGSYQDEDTTRERMSTGECYVMVENGAIIGTIMLYPPNDLPWPAQKWYARPGVASCGQFAVDPELQRKGRGSKLMDFVERRAAEMGAMELALDTSEGADHLIRFYTQRGYRFIEYLQHEGKTYRSAIFSKALDRSEAPVCLVPYDPSWVEKFESEKTFLEKLLAPWRQGPIEHVGSTAVVGLCAKPVIDIMVGVPSLSESEPAKDILREVGYQYAEYKTNVMHWFCKPSFVVRTHHLHLVPFESALWHERLAFRNLLRTNPTVAEEYAALKRELAGRFEFDREAYTDAKYPFIARVLGLSRAP